MTEWFTKLDDSLWLKGDDGAEDNARFIRRALSLRKGQSLLDAPCGKGRISLPMAHAGIRVAGVDLRPQFIGVAQGRFSKEGLAGEFHAMDLRKIEFDNQFHAVPNWHGSFGYFSDAENADLVRRYAHALRPGGRLMIDQPNREQMLRHWIPETRLAPKGQEPRDGPFLMRARWDSARQRATSDWHFKRAGETHQSRSCTRFYTPGQMTALFRRSGLEIEAMYGSWDGAVFTRASRRMVVVGRKP